MPSKQTLLNELQQYIGMVQHSSKHQAMVDAYNRVEPLPVGYRVKYSDDWCDLFVTYIADKIGLSTQIGRECGVNRHRDIMRQKGIWLGKVSPQVGDIIFFDWDGNGFCDHIGFVIQVGNDFVITIEGNSLRQVRKVYYQKQDWRIAGYARPVYQEATVKAPAKSVSELALEVIRGLWGNGAERVRRLTQAGYDAVVVQKLVNQKLLGLKN